MFVAFQFRGPGSLLHLYYRRTRGNAEKVCYAVITFTERYCGGLKNRKIDIFDDKIVEKHNLKLDVDQNYAR